MFFEPPPRERHSVTKRAPPSLTSFQTFLVLALLLSELEPESFLNYLLRHV